jgi:Rhodanese-related sulfurtransferase
MQAQEVFKLITQTQHDSQSVLYTYDIKNHSSHQFKLTNKHPLISVPNTVAELLAFNYEGCSFQEEENSLNEQTLSAFLHDTSTVFVDIRDQNELPRWHHPQLIELTIDQFENAKDVFNSFQQIVLVCQHGLRSKAALSLVKKIFPNKKIFSLDGGISSLVKNYDATQNRRR